MSHSGPKKRRALAHLSTRGSVRKKFEVEYSPGPLDLKHHRDWAVVDERDPHAGAEDALLRSDPLAEAVVEGLGQLGGSGLDVARPRSLPGVPIEGELADAEDLAVAERLVHPAVGVVEDPQRSELLGEAIGVRLGVLPGDSEEDEHPRADLGDPLPLDVDGRLTDALDESSHAAILSVARCRGRSGALGNRP